MFKIINVSFGMLIIVFSSLTYGYDIDKVKNTVTDVCKSKVELREPTIENRSALKASEQVWLEYRQYLSENLVRGATLATNVSCQVLHGSKYTGNEEEWNTFYLNSKQALIQKGANNLSLTLVGTERQLYKGNLPFREYIFKGEFNEGKQIIYNLVVLDIINNILYSISVSGHIKIDDSVFNEFDRVVRTFKIP